MHVCFAISIYHITIHCGEVLCKLWPIFPSLSSVHLGRRFNLLAAVCTLVAEHTRRFVVNTIKLMQWHEKFVGLGNENGHWHRHVVFQIDSSTLTLSFVCWCVAIESIVQPKFNFFNFLLCVCFRIMRIKSLRNSHCGYVKNSVNALKMVKICGINSRYLCTKHDWNEASKCR